MITPNQDELMESQALRAPNTILIWQHDAIGEKTTRVVVGP